jgi:type IV secretion system protein VirD4
MPPIRARKLRYFEDRRFKARLLPPPVLGADGYADKPPRRPHDWSDVCACAPLAGAEQDRSRKGEGGLARAPEPQLGQEQCVALTLVVSDPLGLGGDEDDAESSPPLLARMLSLAPVVAADAINQGSDRGSDLIPSF